MPSPMKLEPLEKLIKSLKDRDQRLEHVAREVSICWGELNTARFYRDHQQEAAAGVNFDAVNDRLSEWFLGLHELCVRYGIDVLAVQDRAAERYQEGREWALGWSKKVSQQAASGDSSGETERGSGSDGGGSNQ